MPFDHFRVGDDFANSRRELPIDASMKKAA
jgi:hypothetical protein